MSLAAQDIRVERAGRPVLDGVDFVLRPGMVTALLGPNGAGKSTLLAVLAGDLAPHAGRVTLDGTSLASLPAQSLARRRAVLPQHSELAFDLSVDQVVGMGAYPFPELSPAQADALVGKALASTDVLALRGRRFTTLSGGERQRVQCARVLAQMLAPQEGGQEPPGAGASRHLLLDEPVSSLDPRHQHGLLRALQTMARQHGFGVLVIAHDINLAARWCDTLVFLAEGRVAAEGPPRQVLDARVLQRVYGLPSRIVRDADRQLVVFGD